MRKTTESQKPNLAQKFASLKEQYPDGILFITFDTGLEAFFDDALVAHALCDLPLLCDVRCGVVTAYVCVSFSQLEQKIPTMLAAGYKVVVVGTKMVQIYQK
jgi:DNA mismatch repair ATPase MutS